MRLRFLILSTVLAGCVAPTTPATLATRQPVLAGAVTLAAPQGYCIESRSRLEKDDSALLLIGRCAGETARSPAVLTATVGQTGSAQGIDVEGGGAEIAAFFRSDRGRMALSRRGRAADVTVHQISGIKGALLLRFSDRGPTRGKAPLQVDGWRALMPVGDRLVTLTVTGLQSSPLTAEAGRALIGQYVDAVRLANR